MVNGKRLSLLLRQEAHPAQAYYGFLNIKRPGVSLLHPPFPPGWGATSSQGYPPDIIMLPWKFAGTHK